MYSKLVWTPCTKYFKKECRNIKKYDYDMKEKWEPIFEGILAHLCAQCSKPKFPSCISKIFKKYLNSQYLHYYVCTQCVKFFLTNWCFHNIFKTLFTLSLFENYSKCLISTFQFWHFSLFNFGIFHQFLSNEMPCLVTLFDHKLQVVKNSLKLTIFGKKCYQKGHF